ncbi:hypothetical protein Btru_074991 [Bulinus truncatus]|nr:hypothetical protein Btru_074991 [Bulinus truncatus]
MILYFVSHVFVKILKRIKHHFFTSTCIHRKAVADTIMNKQKLLSEIVRMPKYTRDTEARAPAITSALQQNIGLGHSCPCKSPAGVYIGHRVIGHHFYGTCTAITTPSESRTQRVVHISETEDETTLSETGVSKNERYSESGGEPMKLVHSENTISMGGNRLHENVAAELNGQAGHRTGAASSGQLENMTESIKSRNVSGEVSENRVTTVDKMWERKGQRDIDESRRMVRVLKAFVERKVRHQTIRLIEHMERARYLLPAYFPVLRRKVFRTLTYILVRAASNDDATQGFSKDALQSKTGDTAVSSRDNRLQLLACLPPRLRLLVDRMRARGQLKLTSLQAIVWSICGARKILRTVIPLTNGHITQPLKILKGDRESYKRVAYKLDKIRDLGSNPVSKLLDKKLESLRSLLEISNRSKNFLKHWGKNLLKLLVNCTRCLTNDGQHGVPGVKKGVNATLPRFNVPRLPLNLNQAMAALFTRVTHVLENQQQRIKKLNSSLVQLQKGLARHHTQENYPPASLKRFFNATMLLLRSKVLVNISFHSTMGVSMRREQTGGDHARDEKSPFQVIAEAIRNATRSVKDCFCRCYQSLKRGTSVAIDKVGSLIRDSVVNWFVSRYNEMTRGHVFSVDSRRLKIKSKLSVATGDQTLVNVDRSELSEFGNGSETVQDSNVAISKSENSTKSEISIEEKKLSFTDENSTVSNSDKRREIHVNFSRNKPRMWMPDNTRGNLEFDLKTSLKDANSQLSSKESNSVPSVKDVVKSWIRNFVLRKIAREKFNRALDGWKTRRDNPIVSEGSEGPKSKTQKKRETVYLRIILKFIQNLLKGKTITTLPESLRKQRISEHVGVLPVNNETVRKKRRNFPYATVRDFIFSRNSLERLARLWTTKAGQLSHLMAWLVMLPQRTLSFVRRMEMANLKLRMVFFKQFLLVHIDSLKQTHGDQEGAESVGQREALRKVNKFTPLNKNGAGHAGEPNQVLRFKTHEKDYKEESRNVSTRPGRNSEKNVNSSNLSVKRNAFERGNVTHSLQIFNGNHNRGMTDEAKENVHFLASINAPNPDDFGNIRKKTPQTHVRLRRSLVDDSSDEAQDKKIMKKLSKISNSRKSAGPGMFEDRGRWGETSVTENTPPRPKEVAASELQSRLLKMIQLMESKRRTTVIPSFRAFEKKKIDDIEARGRLGEKVGVFGDAIGVEPHETFLSASSNLKPTEADYELLDNIELLTERFLNLKKKKQRVALSGQLGDDADQSKRRRKRSDVDEEVSADDLPDPSEVSRVDRLKETGLVEKVRDPKQFLHKWATLRKQAENLKTEVNSARDKYASASDDLDTFLKKGNELHDRVASAVNEQGVYKSKLEENWKNANKEFEKFKSDISAREKELLSEDNRVSPERVDKVMLKLEDAVSEQGDPTDRILGENPVAPFDVDYSKLGPAIVSMKDEAAIAEQASSNEMMLESEDSEDDVFKRSEAGDYSLVDFDYGPDAKFADEEDDQMAEDADALSGFDYEIDRHSDSQLEDVDNMLSRLIARRFRSKREVDGLPDISQPAAVRKNVSQSEPRITEETNYETTSLKNIPFTADSGVNQTRLHLMQRRASLDDIEQAMNYDDEYEGHAEDQPDFGDMIKDVEGQRLSDATMDLSADNGVNFNMKINHSNPASRFMINHLTDLNANNEMKQLEKVSLEEAKRPSNIVVKDKTYLTSVRGRQGADVLNQIDSDSKALGINAKSLRDKIRKQSPEDVVEIPLGSDSDIEDGIEEIKREKKYLSTPYEQIDSDLFSPDDLAPFDQAISENSDEDISERDYDEPEDDADSTFWGRRNSLKKAQQDLVDAEEETQKFKSASYAQRQRQLERLQHEAELAEIKAVSDGLERAMSDLDKATNEVDRPPTNVKRPSKEEQVRSLYAEDAMSLLNKNSDSFTSESQMGPNGSGVLLRKRRSVDEPGSIAAKLFIKNASMQSSQKNAESLISNESQQLVNFEATQDEKIEVAKRAERDANLTSKEASASSTTPATDTVNMGVEIEDESPGVDAEIYDDDVMYSDEGDDDVVMDEWGQTRPPQRKQKGKKKVKDDELVDDRLLNAKVVVKQMKDEEEVAGDLLPPNTLIDSDRDLMEFGRKPDMKDVFYNKFSPAGVVELNEDELRSLDGPVLSTTDIEKNLEDPTEMLTGLDDIEGEIEEGRQSLMSQARDLSREASGEYLSPYPEDRTGADDGATSDEAVESVFRQISSEDDMGNEALEKKAISERHDLLDDMRETRLRQKISEAEDVGVDGEVLGDTRALNEALQDLDQISVDSDMDNLRTFVDFKDVRKMKENDREDE